MSGYIYSLANPETNEIRYIGITFQSKKPLWRKTFKITILK